MASFYVECAGLFLVFLFAALCRDYKKSIVAGILIMTVTNIVSQIIIAGGGGGAFVGFFIMPLVGIILASITVGLVHFIILKIKPPIEDIVVKKKKMKIKE